MRDVYGEGRLHGAPLQRVQDKWRSIVEDMLERSGIRDPFKAFGYSPDNLVDFLKEYCEPDLEENECVNVLSRVIFGTEKKASEIDYQTELEKAASALLNDIMETFGIESRADVIRMSFSLDPKKFELAESCREYVKMMLEAKYGVKDVRLVPVKELVSMKKMYIYKPPENVDFHRQFLLARGYTEITDFKGISRFYNADSVFYTDEYATACYYSDDKDVIFMCDSDSLMKSDRKKIFIVIGHYYVRSMEEDVCAKVMRSYNLNGIPDVFKMSIGAIYTIDENAPDLAKMCIQVKLKEKYRVRGVEKYDLLDLVTKKGVIIVDSYNDLLEVRNDLLSKGYTEITDWRYVYEFFYGDNVFFIDNNTTACYISDENVLFICDGWSLMKNDRKKIFMLIGHY